MVIFMLLLLHNTNPTTVYLYQEYFLKSKYLTNVVIPLEEDFEEYVID